MQFLTILVVIFIAVVLVYAHMVWLAVFLLFMVILWLARKAGGAAWGTTKSLGSGLKDDAHREWDAVEANSGKHPSGKLGVDLGKKVSKKAADTIFPEYGKQGSSSLPQLQRSKEDTGSLAEKIAKNIIDAGKDLLKK